MITIQYNIKKYNGGKKKMVRNENQSFESELGSLLERTMRLEYELDLVRSQVQE